MEEKLGHAFFGALGGLAYGGIAYLKKRKQEGVAFDPLKLGLTCLVSCGVGLFVALEGNKNPLDLVAYSASITFGVEQAYKILKG